MLSSASPFYCGTNYLAKAWLWLDVAAHIAKHLLARPALLHTSLYKVCKLKAVAWRGLDTVQLASVARVGDGDVGKVNVADLEGCVVVVSELCVCVCVFAGA